MQKPDLYNLSVVLLGNFNPIIINPHWLVHKGLIRESDIKDDAGIDVVHPEISRFSLSFSKVQVTKDKFQLDCQNEADFELCKDLVISIFRYLAETPVSGIGINHTRHFNLKVKDDYVKFGKWLVPDNPWKDDMHEPGILELKMVESDKEDTTVRNIAIISPSGLVRPYGVCFQLNYHIHYDRMEGKSIDGVIEENWTLSSEKASTLYNNVLNKFKNG